MIILQKFENKNLDDLQSNPIDIDNNPCKLFCNIPVNFNDIPCTEIDPGEARTNKIFQRNFSSVTLPTELPHFDTNNGLNKL